MKKSEKMEWQPPVTFTATSDFKNELEPEYWTRSGLHLRNHGSAIGECEHELKRLFYITNIEDYGETIRDSLIKKCFKCGLLTEEE